MNKLLLCLAILCFSLTINAQKNSYRIDGMAFDTLNDPLVAATVLLLEKSDSTMIDFARTDLDGSFVFKKVPPGQHVVKVTYLGFIPMAIDASSEDGSNVDVGRMELTEIAQELMEVVIKAAKAPMKIRGDTIEYDATTFKVPPGSTVEELLRRLPGMEVGQDGALTSEGIDVNRVTVDGKSFFGSDPKAATKNLPAEGISKIQVFDTKSEEEEITGATSQAQSKTMNLELKDDFKKGGFGKVIGGVGTAPSAEGAGPRTELKGNYNKFNDKIQFAVIGVGNNTGRNGLGWNDYQDFMGSNSFNFNDGGDYGFGGGGGRFFTFGGGDDSGIESSIQSVFFNRGNGGGFPVNYNGGMNFNYDHNDNVLNSVYYYNQSGLERETVRNSENYFNDFTSSSESRTRNNNLSNGHRAEVSFERKIDSLLDVKINLNVAAVSKNNQAFGSTELSRDDVLTTTSAYKDLLRSDGYLINGQVILRKKFMKKGRRAGLNASYLNTALEDDGTLESENEFYRNGIVDSISLIDQINRSNANKNQFKANALFVEPLSKKFFFQTFFNHSTRIEDGDRDVFDITNETQNINGFLSRVFENRIMLNRYGALVRYSYKGVNVSLGGAYQGFLLTGLYDGKGEENINGEINETYNRFIPNFSLNMSPVKNSYFSVNYNVNAREPSIQNLQPIVDNRNPLFLREGNPDLVPETTHSVSTRYSINKPATSLRFSVNLNYDYSFDQIINEQTVDENLVSYTRPINFTGGERFGTYMSLSVPIWKNKITTRMGFSGNYNKSFAIVNTVENETNSIGYSPNIRFNVTMSENLSFYANANFNIVNTRYNINTSLDQRTVNNRYSVEFNAKTFGGIFLNSNFSYSTFRNDQFGFDQSIPILNASVYKRFLEGDKLETRISLYDGFDQNLNASQFASENGINSSTTAAIGRYFMFSLTYNIRGMKSDVRKDSWW